MSGKATASIQQAKCPECGHFTGPLGRCGHCGKQIGIGIRLKSLRIASLFLAIIGLFLLHLFSIYREIPLIPIGSVKPMMNFATVRIEGVVVSDARTFKSGGMYFSVNDGSGMVSVILGKPQADELLKKERLPLAGDKIGVTGVLNIGAGRDPRLRVQSARQVQFGCIVAKSGGRLSEISISRKGEIVTVQGRVAKIWIPPKGSRAPHRIVLRDDSGQLNCIYWDAVADSLKKIPEIGSLLEITGQVDVYKNEVQLRVRYADEIKTLDGLE